MKPLQMAKQLRFKKIGFTFQVNEGFKLIFGKPFILNILRQSCGFLMQNPGWKVSRQKSIIGYDTQAPVLAGLCPEGNLLVDDNIHKEQNIHGEWKYWLTDFSTAHPNP